MPWKRPNPDLQNDPSYLTPRLNEVDAQLADTEQDINILTLGVGVIPEKFPKLTGEPDDTARLQRLMQSVKTVGGGIVTFPKNHNFSVTQFVIDADNLRIEGNGSTITQNTVSTDATTDENVVFALSRKNISVRNLYIDGGKTVNTVVATWQHAGIWLEDCDGVFLENVNVSNTGCDGIAIRSCYNYTLLNCSTKKTHEDGIVANHDVNKWGSPKKNINARILYCDVFDSSGDAILTKIPDVLVMGCKSVRAGIEEVRRCGGIIAGTDGDIQPKNVQIIGNYIENVTGAGVYSAAAENIIIKDNIINNNPLWKANTLYQSGEHSVSNGNIYLATTGGNSSTTAPSGTGSSISDGTVIWKYVRAVAVDNFRGIELVPGTYATVLKQIKEAIIDSNVIKSVAESVFVHGCQRVDVKGNQAKSSGVGRSPILIDNTSFVSTDIQANGNTLEAETTSAVALKVVASSKVQSNDNKIIAAFDGILFDGVGSGQINNTFIDGSIARNGITSKDSTCQINNNKVKGCGTTGIWVRGATNANAKNNFISGNHITGCTNGIFTDSTAGKNVAIGNLLFSNTANINMNIGTTGSIGDSTNNTVY
jgi:parallel beta-helix repeat protein